jgi:PleD family two-component response regulator
MLTAKEDEDRIVDAFHAGADDFVTKPFNPRILLARVGAGQRIVELQLRIDADKRVREQQVAEMGLLTRKLRAAALTDVLTELPNRRYAMNRLEHEWDAAVRLDRPLSVSMIDIDEFKRINDLHGHDVGDSVLKATAATLRSYTRRGDVICRLGGEEFIVIHVNCIGIAERSATFLDADVLLKAADQAVYAAKAAGRNCCKLSGPGDWLVRSARAQ